ncbi:Homoserine/homoserine lactone efflux protein [Vibrio aerogenes CECT 7868]|uniref:Homoserine/homoserine lactone efflux protein n=1 Tax=Vibrio aerogenes CECT 7868 TaxID=1216006 RepID=A0A1M6CCT4_9VIBR|nr:LysE family transporter [Vibrio aerogenes]SHI58574.1 Homoserine/homoserine lactone efflux protein [Vibrio aerogenes CECT 7868]
MQIHQWLMFLFVISALIAFPGPSAILCLTHGAKYGARKALGTIFGGGFAALTLMSLSAFGVGAVLQSSASLFLFLKIAGGIYLIYLGIQTWRSESVRLEQPSASVNLPAKQVPFSHCFKRGYIVGAGNPKDLLFFGALFPQFIDPGSPFLPQLLILAVTWFVMDCSIMFFYAAAGKKVAVFLSGFGSGKLFNRVSGSAFIVAGGVLAATSR